MNMKTFTKWLAIFSSLALFILFFGCKKDNSASSNASIPPGKARVSVVVMDGPVAFDSVLIDIRQIAVEVDTAQHQNDPDEDDFWGDDFWGRGRDRDHRSVIWDTLSITPGLYDLLRLRNGTDSLLAAGITANGKILKVRVTLGNDNTIFTDSVTHYPLEVFGPHPYFDINVRRQDVSVISNNQFKLWLDFNLHKSIFFWNGTFLLKPELVVFNDNMTAKLQGKVLPERASPLVEAFNQTDTLYALPNEDGYYLFRNVNAGTYSIFFKGQHGYRDSTISNIVVPATGLTKAPTVTLHK
jgi:hypothetical protein